METMTEEEFEEMNHEMMFCDNLRTDANKEELVAMYYTALQVISDNTDMGVIEVHNEVIMESIGKVTDTLELILDGEPRTH